MQSLRGRGGREGSGRRGGKGRKELYDKVHACSQQVNYRQSVIVAMHRPHPPAHVLLEAATPVQGQLVHPGFHGYVEEFLVTLLPEVHRGHALGILTLQVQLQRRSHDCQG